MSVPFRERNPVIIGAISLAVIALLILAAFRASDLPLIGGGDTYYAEFSESGGLQVNDEVRIAGVRVGKVESVELDGDKVKVGFKVKTDSEFGEETARRDQGQDPARRDVPLAACRPVTVSSRRTATIPVERTTSPFDVVDAFSGLAETSADIDTDQLAESLTTLADLTRNTPEEFRGALEGVSALSETIASRDDQINSLLNNLERVSTVLDDRDQDIVAADARLRRAVPGPGVAARRRSTTCWSPPPRCPRSSPRWSPRAGPTSSPPSTTSRTSSPCSTRTRTTSTTASG